MAQNQADERLRLRRVLPERAIALAMQNRWREAADVCDQLPDLFIRQCRKRRHLRARESRTHSVEQIPIGAAVNKAARVQRRSAIALPCRCVTRLARPFVQQTTGRDHTSAIRQRVSGGVRLLGKRSKGASAETSEDGQYRKTEASKVNVSFNALRGRHCSAPFQGAISRA